MCLFLASSCTKRYWNSSKISIYCYLICCLLLLTLIRWRNLPQLVANVVHQGADCRCDRILQLIPLVLLHQTMFLIIIPETLLALLSRVAETENRQTVKQLLLVIK